MFQRDEYVYYASGGICRVADIQIAPLKGMPADREYYVLHSLHDPSGVIYVPVNSESVFLRKLMTREEAEALMASLREIPLIEEPNAKALRAAYIEMMKQHSPGEWVRVIKTVYRRSLCAKGSRAAPRVSDSERAFAADAKRYLYTELSLVLGQTPEQTEAHVCACVEEAVG